MWMLCPLRMSKCGLSGAIPSRWRTHSMKWDIQALNRTIEWTRFAPLFAMTMASPFHRACAPNSSQFHMREGGYWCRLYNDSK